MPIARIFTREEMPALVQRLQDLGYAVEIIAPGSAQPGEADVEITIEKHLATDAVARARELARQDQCDVFVAEGAVAQSAAAPVEEEAAGEAPKLQLEVERGNIFRETWESASAYVQAWREQRSEAHRDKQARRLLQAAEAAQRLQEAEQERARRALEARQREEHRRREEEIQRLAREHEENRRRQEELQQLLERASEQQQRRRVEEEHRIQEPVPEVVEPVVAPPRPQPAPHPPRVHTFRTRPRRIRSINAGGARALRRAAKLLLIAAFVGALAWLAIANRRPASPVPAAALVRSAALQQAYPFAPVTAQPSAHPKPAVVPRPQPQKPAAHTAPAKPAKPAAGKTQSKRKTKPMRRSSNDDVIAEDVVVRHYPAKGTTTQTKQTAGVRRITDED